MKVLARRAWLCLGGFLAAVTVTVVYFAVWSETSLDAIVVPCLVLGLGVTAFAGTFTALQAGDAEDREGRGR